jgi:hypothetical protein
MKLVVIDLEGSTPEGRNFANTVSSCLGIEILHLDLYDIESKNSYEFGRFSKAAFSLEKLILDTPDYWTANKPFINAMYVWKDYCIDDIHHLKEFNNVYIRDLLVFHTYYRKDDPSWHPSWVFGNIVAMIKWSTSLFKIDKSVYDTFDNRDLSFYRVKDPMIVPLWYANRLNFDVRLIYKKVDE